MGPDAGESGMRRRFVLLLPLLAAFFLAPFHAVLFIW